jgi:8-oxo-dGTP diphosphatase
LPTDSDPIWAGAAPSLFPQSLAISLVFFSKYRYNCYMTDTRPLFTIGAFAIIFDDYGRVLLCHRRDMDAWNLPGGGLEPGELPNECVVREVREETGLEVRVDRLVGVYAKPGRNELVFAFVCQVVGGTLILTAETDANAFFIPEEMPPNTLLKHAERVLDAVRGETSAFIRQGNQRRVV